jgi:hypothetical protein
MDAALVIRGRVCGGAFIAAEPVPDVDASAELIVFASAEHGPPGKVPASSIFDLFGQAGHLRSGADIDAQIRDERAWGDA